ncbi:MAG: hypothetical protein DMF07_05875, partial [Verrucomicrobia bacterium]
MTSAQIRQSFLDFFREKKHTIVPSSSLLPDAPNLLFTNAGMNQFVPIFLGQQKPPQQWKFPAQRLYATVYKPGPGEPSEFDQEAYDHWANLFREADLDPAIHVLSSGKADNFWMMGDTGPCGPCSEVHVDLTPDGDTRGELVNKEDPRCIEIWNLVFIQFNAQPVAGGGDPGHMEFVPLPQRHVDTGMGFERVTAIIQGTKNLTDFSGTISNYETDIFSPIFDELEKLSGKKYASMLPIVGQAHRLPVEEGSRSGRPTSDPEREKIDVAFRVIADHIRALSFAIADGIIPSNEGRGYVLRRILRRAVRYGRTLEFHEPFFFKLVDVVAKTMGDVFPEIRAKEKTIKDVIRREEVAFNRTLDLGMSLFQKAVDSVESSPAFLKDDSSLRADYGAVEYERDASGEQTVFHYGRFQRDEHGNVRKRISGEVAFRLYDTYGFPLDLTELLARERAFTVDVTEFEELMEQQRARGRGAQKKIKLSADLAFAGELEAKKISPTKFLGYDSLETESVVETVLPDRKTDELNIVLDRTPFYAEMGGQVGDRGLLHVPGHDRTEVGQLRVTDTQKRGDVFVHRATLLQGRAPEPGEAVRVSVDADRRRATQGHHTVTHLLHWALHEVVSRDASQKGSYVGPDKLTFDFSSAALTKQQLRDVERLV